jgi:hypothetical protein
MTLYPVDWYNGYELKKRRRKQIMKKEMTIQEAGTASGAKPDSRALLAEYLAEQPQSRRIFDKLMKVLEVAGLALIAGHLAWAIYVSINWSVPQQIVAVWFALPVSVVALLVLVGVHAAGLGAFFPVILPGGPQEFATGSKAVASGVGFAATLLLVGAFWGAFAWGKWTTNWALLEPLMHVLGVVVGVGVVFAVVSDLYKRFFRSR